MKKTIYLDNAATTKTRPEVVEAMLPYFTEFYGNPSSIYSFSDEPKKAVAAGREAIAKSIAQRPTSCISPAAAASLTTGH